MITKINNISFTSQMLDMYIQKKQPTKTSSQKTQNMSASSAFYLPQKTDYKINAPEFNLETIEFPNNAQLLLDENSAFKTPTFSVELTTPKDFINNSAQNAILFNILNKRFSSEDFDFSFNTMTITSKRQNDSIEDYLQKVLGSIFTKPSQKEFDEAKKIAIASSSNQNEYKNAINAYYNLKAPSTEELQKTTFDYVKNIYEVFLQNAQLKVVVTTQKNQVKDIIAKLPQTKKVSAEQNLPSDNQNKTKAIPRKENMPAQRLYCLQNNPTIADEVYFSLIVEILNDRLNKENMPATISSYKNDSESLILLEAEKEDTIDTLINSLKSKPITQEELDNVKSKIKNKFEQDFNSELYRNMYILKNYSDKPLKIEKFTNAINKASILQLQELLKNMLSNNVVKTEEKN